MFENNKISNRWIATWLGIMVWLVVFMIVIGGATRLTNSGLSITEWLPIRGAIPPLSHEAWLAEFDKYKQIPEFLAEHPDMDLAGFEFIYFMEWSHRQLGRIIGLVYALPFFYLLLKRKLPSRRAGRFGLVLILIGVQGAIGWWMVHSGLQEGRVDVSQYRLATHLGMAFIILGLLHWMRLDAKASWPVTKYGKSSKGRSSLLLAFVYIQIISGAFVAGLHAGKTYNTWPLMDGSFVPEGYLTQSPLWRNFFENIAAVQFNHRFWAYIVLAMALYVFVSTKGQSNRLSKHLKMLLAILFVQVCLGIATLLMAAPLNFALAHQFLAIFVFLAAVSTCRVAWVQR